MKRRTMQPFDTIGLGPTEGQIFACGRPHRFPLELPLACTGTGNKEHSKNVRAHGDIRAMDRWGSVRARWCAQIALSIILQLDRPVQQSAAGPGNDWSVSTLRRMTVASPGFSKAGPEHGKHGVRACNGGLRTEPSAGYRETDRWKPFVHFHIQKRGQLKS